MNWGAPARGRHVRRRWEQACGIVALFLWPCVAGGAPRAAGDPAAGIVLETQEAASSRPIAPPSRAAGASDDSEARPPLNRKPILIKAPPAEYPKEFAGTGMSGEVVVTLLVDRMGRASHIRVESTPDPAFTEAVMEALAGFEFLPAIRSGRLTNASMRLRVPVNEDMGDRALVDFEGGRIELLGAASAGATDTPARRLFGPRPAYPLELLAAGKPGEVVVEFTIGDQGAPQHVKVLESTFVEFTRAVEGALVMWRYSPALSGATPVPTALRYRFSFQADEIPETTRATARRLLAGETTDVVPTKQVDVQPRVRSRIIPAVHAGPAGDSETERRAEVRFIVDNKGVVRLPRVVSASDPISGYTALTAVSYWRFEPALRKKQPVPVLVTLPLQF